MVPIFEYGGTVAGVFKEGADTWAGKVVNVVSEYITGQYLVEIWSKAIGKEVKFFPCPMEMYVALLACLGRFLLVRILSMSLSATLVSAVLLSMSMVDVTLSFTIYPRYLKLDTLG